MTPEELARARAIAIARARMATTAQPAGDLATLFGPAPTREQMLEALPDYNVTPAQLSPNRGLPSDFTPYTQNDPGTHFLPGDPRDPTPSLVRDPQLNRGQGNALINSATLNFGDELAGLIGGIGGAFDPNRTFGEGYNQSRDAFNADLAYAQQQDPNGVFFGTLMGGLAAPAALAGRGISFLNGARPTVGSIMSRTAAEGTAYGALAGAGGGDTMEERLRGAGIGAVAGGATGAAAGGLVGRSVVRSVDNAIPTAAQSGAAANAAYSAGRDARVYLNPNIADSIEQSVIATAQRNPLSEFLSPAAYGYVRELTDKGRIGSSLSDLEAFRQELRRIAESPNQSDRRIALDMIREFDNQLNALPDSAFVSATGMTPTEARAAFQQGREQWGIRSRAEAIERAQYVAANAPNASVDPAARQRALTTQFRQIANDPDFTKLWSPEEQAAILQVVRGGNADNLLRGLANFVSPLRLTPGTLGVGGALAGGGVAAFGPAGAAAALIPPAVGALARGGARSIGNTNAKLAELLIRNNMQPIEALGPGQRAALAAMLSGTAQNAWSQQ